MLADIPGLIEGAAEGAGVGTRFLGHVERCSVLLHLVDISPRWEGGDPVHEARAIVEELRKYDQALFEKPRWLVLNKIDALPEDEVEACCNAITEALGWSGPTFRISALDGSGLKELTYGIMNFLEDQKRQ